ncbi:hypothetical protein [Microbacterium sp. R86528]
MSVTVVAVLTPKHGNGPAPIEAFREVSPPVPLGDATKGIIRDGIDRR